MLSNTGSTGIPLRIQPDAVFIGDTLDVRHPKAMAGWTSPESLSTLSLFPSFSPQNDELFFGFVFSLRNLQFLNGKNCENRPEKNLSKREIW